MNQDFLKWHNNLKTGDEVCCVNTDIIQGRNYGAYLTKNKIYIITRIDDDGCFWVQDDNGSRRGFFAERFGPVEINPHKKLKNFLETGDGDAEEIIRLFTRT